METRSPRLKDVVEQWIIAGDAPDGPNARGNPSVGAATSGASFLGKDTSDPNATGEAIYSDPKNLPMAIASILNRVQGHANFHSRDASPGQLAAVFPAYITQFDEAPFFSPLRVNAVEQVLNKPDYDLPIDQVINLYKDVSVSDREIVRRALAGMARSVFGQEDAKEWKNIFS